MNTTRTGALYKAFSTIGIEQAARLGNWTYHEPFVISPQTNATMHRIQKGLHKAIRHFVEGYDNYASLLPVAPQVRDILNRCKRVPYRTGTYRADFLIDTARQIQVIEITCRFALNGFFMTGFAHLLIERYLADHPNIRRIDDYTPYFQHFSDYFGPFDHVCILKGADNRNETKYYIPILEHAGYPVHIIPTTEIADNLALLKNAAVIGELDHDELCSLDMTTIDAIIDSNLLNDLRTVFLIHDKRFFAVLTDDGFLNAALAPDEVVFMRQHIVPTCSRLMRPDLWQTAQQDKDGWIIKQRNWGKSINVYAGCVTDQAEWQAIFASELIDDMVLQPYIDQHKVQGTVGNQEHDDWVTGTLLYFDDHFFGPGIFRASSYPITNKVDDRKLSPLVTPDTHLFDPELVL